MDVLQDLIKERDTCLPPILSSLDNVDQCAKLLQNVKLSTKYLSTYDISNVDQELLQYIIPPVKKCLLKVYEDNFLLSDTVEDEFVIKMLKENFQVATGLIQIAKTVLEFVSQNIEVNLCHLKNIVTDLAEIISSTFEHCKNSTDVYKNSFNEELLELFKITQEIHLLFLKLFELKVVVKNEPDNIGILAQVLDTICGMSETLTELNIKSMSDNWKGFTAIVQKFSTYLLDTIDLKSPILCLNNHVNRNLSSIATQDEINVNLASQIVKITSFVIKVALKICDIFWDSLERVSEEVLTFCCTIYSFPIDLYRSKGYSSEILILMDNSIFKIIEPLLSRLSKDSSTLKVFSQENLSAVESNFGLANFLNNFLKVLVAIQTNISPNVIEIINAIFTSIATCFSEFFWEGEPTEGIFDNLVVNISAVVILFDESYAEVEIVLLKSLLQEHIFAALLAMEVWTLLLRNSPPQFRLLTLTNLIQRYQEIKFGLFASRPEQIYLKCFIQRVFWMLPNGEKNDFVLRYNPVRSMECWRTVLFKGFPHQQRLSIEGVCMVTVDKIEALRRGNTGVKDVTIVAENLGALSTVKFDGIGLDPANLTRAVYSLWEFSLGNGDVAENNIFQYFVAELCKVTLGLEFSNNQAITVLSQLKALSDNDSYKLTTCNFLSTLGSKPYGNRYDNFKVSSLIADIICHNLLPSTSNVIRQEALEVVHNFAINEYRDMVTNILRLSGDIQGEISNYLRRNAVPIRPDKEYLTLLGSFSFNHECLKWKNETDLPKSKKLKCDDRLAIGEGVGDNYDIENLVFKKQGRYGEKQTAKPSKWCKAAELGAKAVEDDEANIGDVIMNIKGEVKCLANVLRTEKMTPKNASDIRLIANQLLSFL